MPRHEEQATLAYSADDLFAVVADVKDYPAFVPWCSGARIRRADEREILADLVIGFGPFQESFHVAAGMFHEAATRMMSAFESRVHLVHMMRRRATQPAPS